MSNNENEIDCVTDVPMINGIEVKVGQKWRTKNGMVPEKVTEVTLGVGFVTDDCHTYNLRGQYFDDDETSEDRPGNLKVLVEDVDDELEELPQEEVDIETQKEIDDSFDKAMEKY